MGRKPMEIGSERTYLNSIFDQLRRFSVFGEPAYIKPHGAFYNDTGIVLPKNWRTAVRRDPPPASAYEAGGLYLAQFPGVQSLMLLLRMHRLPLMGLAATAHREIAARASQSLIHEGFADRRYAPDGTLVPRSEPGAVLEDITEVREQAVLIAADVDSICLHGDTPNSLAFAEAVFKALVNAGYGVGV